MYPVVNVADDAAELTEQLGTKPKFWFESNDGVSTLFKEARPDTGEDWAEKIAAELAELLKLPHALYDLATWRGRRGVVSPTFVPSGGHLLHGNELIAQAVPDYPETKFFCVSQHTLDIVMAFVSLEMVKVPTSFVASGDLQVGADVFIGYLMLDAWIGNQDRHHQNWALILHPDLLQFRENIVAWAAEGAQPMDTDGDGHFDSIDNCPSIANADQLDRDSNGVGDACNDFEDFDGDDWADNRDNCPQDFNPNQEDADLDLLGDVCDPFPDDRDNEKAQCFEDLDQALIELQECRDNPLFPDEDGDGEADPTDACPATPDSTPVDGNGCSLVQFCAGFDVSEGQGGAICNNADWKNNEVLGNAKDCKARAAECLPQAGACGLGFELALMLSGLMWLWQRRAGRR